MQKAIFIDKDGDLVHDIPYNTAAGTAIMQAGRIDGLEKLSDKNFLFIVVTNQLMSDSNYLTEKELAMVEAHIGMLLIDDDIGSNELNAHHNSPDGIGKKEEVSSDAPKFMSGLLLKAARDFNIDLNQSWMIGDILNDVEAGNSVGCQSIFIDKSNKAGLLIDSETKRPSFTAKNLAEAADFIENAIGH